ncbi:MAG: valine--tRNA ligase [Verrucomicrobiales bacterium]|nr:valine--tRNA ligase [Verrucomicrobiales bacterium]
MSEIPKAYEPQSVEEKWYQFWCEEGCFTADPARVNEQRPGYSIVIPPPNVTGMLHLGHVLNNTIQDILSRKARMDGREVLWLPGTDHAGIATQVQVEKALKREEKKTKYDLGREEFLKRVWAWKEKHGGIIIQQLKKLGCSCDWTRERFTMDEDYSRCVQKVFVDLYKKGLIYRGKRMVNWCPVSQTALSDEEVEMKPQKGFLWYFRVEVADAPEAPATESSAGEGTESDGKDEKPTYGPIVENGKTYLLIATTRPETIPGDTAVAVNPKDPRYTHLVGKHVIRPLPVENQARIPIVADEHIDIEFGTGVLKVTPAHDKADFDIGQRHQLPAVDVLNPDGTMSELAGADLKGLDRFEARKVAAAKLTEIGALVKEERYENNVGFSQRADVPIEPRLSEQWFLKYPSVKEALACVEQAEEGSARGSRADSGGSPESSSQVLKLEGDVLDAPSNTARGPRALPGKMRFHPDRWAKVYDHWLSNIQDWCISRQLWWGHRIPAWTQPVTGPTQWVRALPQAVEENTPWTTDLQSSRGFDYSLSGVPGHTTVFQRYRLHGGGPGIYAATLSSVEEAKLAEYGFTQDPDVLDTWFSSWLWPFATMGWTGDPAVDAENPMLKAFYPTSDLVTGPDIIFFWVARMIMAGYEWMGDLPFRNVYFTGIIRDKQGRKMSKTLGNSPDPLDLIAKYGADALRFGVMRSAPLGQDVLFDEKDVELGRNFCNKLWNACRFRQMQGGEVEGEINPALLGSDDKWILLRLDQAICEIDEAFADYKFNEVTATLYRFFWSEFCDWYLEAAKAAFQGEDPARKANVLAVIDFVLGHMLRVFHPFLPFITEELWHDLGYAEDLPEDQGGKTIMVAHWPKPFDNDVKAHYGLEPTAEQLANAKYDLVTKGRNFRREFNIPANKKIAFALRPAGQLESHEADVIRLLLNAETLEVNPAYVPPKGTPSAHSPLGELYLPLEGLIDAEAEKARLTKELAKVEVEIQKVEQKLGNENFTARAPAHVLAEHRQRLADWQARQEQIRAAVDCLS